MNNRCFAIYICYRNLEKDLENVTVEYVKAHHMLITVPLSFSPCQIRLFLPIQKLNRLPELGSVRGASERHVVQSIGKLLPELSHCEALNRLYHFRFQYRTIREIFPN